MVNKIILVGRVGSDPEVREVNDTKVAEFSLATNESWKDKDGNKKESTEWHNVVMWRGLAGVAEQYIKKGDLLYVEGKKETQTWEKDGETKYKTIIQAKEMKMLGSKGGGSSDSSPAPSEPAKDDLPF